MPFCFIVRAKNVWRIIAVLLLKRYPTAAVKIKIIWEKQTVRCEQ